MGNTKPIGVAYADPDLDSAVISGALTAASAAVSGAVSAASVAASGAISAASASITGAVGAGSVVSSGAISGTTVTASGGVRAGASASPIAQATAASVNQFYVTASHASGDLRGIYARVNYTGAGAGETLRAFSTVAAAQGAGQTTNGAHISLSVNAGGSISGAANALRATLGVAAGLTPGGTLAAIQIDSDLGAGAVLSGADAFMRFTNSGAVALDNLMNVPAAMVVVKGASTGFSHVVKFVDSTGAVFYLMATDSAP